MEVYLDNEAAYNPVEADLAALDDLSGVSGGLSEAGAAVISESDISGIPGLMQLISLGKFPDNAFTLAAAAFDEGIVRYDLSEYVTEQCRDYYLNQSDMRILNVKPVKRPHKSFFRVYVVLCVIDKED